MPGLRFGERILTSDANGSWLRFPAGNGWSNSSAGGSPPRRPSRKPRLRHRGTLCFHDIEIDRAAGGKPVCRLSDEAWARLGLRGADTAIHVSITHDHALASAYVIVERLG